METIPRGRMVDMAYEWIEEKIVTLQLAPGSTMSELQLSEMTGFGRTPIREAVQRLAREHLIVVLPQRGLLVPPMDVSKQLRLLETRREVERLIARSAAKKASAAERDHFARLAKAFRSSARSGKDVEFIRADRDFNELCLVAARNEFAEGAMRLMHGLSRRFWYYHYKEAADLPTMARLHAEVAEAVAAGDVKKAGDAVDALLNNIEAFTRATVLGERV
ncbi:GntR family transcriptional regulator [Pandoraea faecigallinarum]|uniref:GntR family transcriptional regulator n=1 Tax=Pandoraea faecigallinarum TaxID=656179 RepID=A0A0H3WVN9_9BURK|nr:GntR family transcriptional regulator [Pandoraea faecigallinarum]AKM32269.1 GntR family transcriptional regulator [Pandoraea faecigallinarum]